MGHFRYSKLWAELQEAIDWGFHWQQQVEAFLAGMIINTGFRVEVQRRMCDFFSDSVSIWVWVKIRYPNNWMVNTKLD